MQEAMFVSYDVQDWGIALRMRPKPEEASEFPSSVCLTWLEAQQAFAWSVRERNEDTRQRIQNPTRQQRKLPFRWMGDQQDADQTHTLNETMELVLRSQSWGEYHANCGGAIQRPEVVVV